MNFVFLYLCWQTLRNIGLLAVVKALVIDLSVWLYTISYLNIKHFTDQF